MSGYCLIEAKSGVCLRRRHQRGRRRRQRRRPSCRMGLVCRAAGVERSVTVDWIHLAKIAGFLYDRAARPTPVPPFFFPGTRLFSRIPLARQDGSNVRLTGAPEGGDPLLSRSFADGSNRDARSKCPSKSGLNCDLRPILKDPSRRLD